MALHTISRFSFNIARNIKLNVIKKNVRVISMNQPALKKKEIQVTFIKSNGDVIKSSGKVGDSLYDVVKNNHLDIDGYGSCDGALACSTCHVILKKEVYDSLPDPEIEEEDMLEMGYDITETSRLGCQIKLSEQLDGLEVRFPSRVLDQREVV